MSVRPKTLPDDHDATIELFLDAASARARITGVLHVGAHQGQEIPHYRAHGIPKIVLVEANPEHCEFLKRAFSDGDVSIVNCAIADFDGTVELNVNHSRTGNDESSSILALKEFSAILPTMHTDRTIAVPAFTLDSLARDHDLRGCNFLNIDIQGAEILALRGGRKTLRQADLILIETNLIEMYAGCALEAEIDNELMASGFSCIERVYHELYQGDHRFPAWGESLYLRA